MKVFYSVLYPNIKSPKEYQDLEGIPESTAAEKIVKKIVKANNLSMDNLHIYMESDNATGCLAMACYDEQQKRLAHEAWDNLQSNYAKNDILSA